MRYGVPVILKSVIAADLSMYCLRHTYCTGLEAAGVLVNVAKDLLGHKRITMNSRVYTRSFDIAVAKAYALEDARRDGKITAIR